MEQPKPRDLLTLNEKELIYFRKPETVTFFSEKMCYPQKKFIVVCHDGGETKLFTLCHKLTEEYPLHFKLLF